MIELRTVVPALIAFAVTGLMGPFVIPALRRLKMSQTERTYGMETHLKKAGTPTMGGVMILSGITIACAVFIPSSPQVGPVLFLTLAFGLIGFMDDYLKVVKRNSDGLIAWQKLLLEFGVTLIFWLYIRFGHGISLDLRIPFMHGHTVNIGILAVPLLFFAVLGTVNAVNFTDGIDGLASSVTIVAALFFLIAAAMLQSGASPAASAVIGALLGFLLYNAYPAQVFMGDTGSLALGGFVAGMAYMLQMPLFILIVGIIYLCEILSVMIQVSYFKATHGKRIFKMTPIHHHFEKCGWSETRIVTTFTAITAIAVMIALLAL